jgi:hypothetical protein
MFLPFFNLAIFNDFLSSNFLKVSPSMTFESFRVFINFDTLNQVSYDYFSTVFFGLKLNIIYSYFALLVNYFIYLLNSFNYFLIIFIFIFLKLFKFKKNSLFFHFHYSTDYFTFFIKLKSKLKSFLLKY